MWRVLKPGKRFVIVDGFIKSDPKKFSRLLQYCYSEICKGWALPSFPQLSLLINELKKQGADRIEIKDFLYRVAPSVMHAPVTVIYFLIKKMLQGEKLNPIRMGHLKACLLDLVRGCTGIGFLIAWLRGVRKNKNQINNLAIC